MTGISLVSSSSTHTGKNTPTQKVTAIKNTDLAILKKEAKKASNSAIFFGFMAAAVLPIYGFIVYLLNSIPGIKETFSAIINNSGEASELDKSIFASFVIFSASILGLLSVLIFNTIKAHKLKKELRELKLQANHDAGTSEVTNSKGISFRHYLIKTQKVLKNTRDTLTNTNSLINKKTLKVEDFEEVLLKIVRNYQTLLSKEDQHSSHNLPLPDKSGNFTMDEYLAYDPAFRSAINSAAEDVKKITSDLKNIDPISPTSEQDVKLSLSKALRIISKLGEFNQSHILNSLKFIETGCYTKTRYTKDDFNLIELQNLVATVDNEISAEKRNFMVTIHETELLALKSLAKAARDATVASANPTTQLESATTTNDAEKNTGAENSRS